MGEFKVIIADDEENVRYLLIDLIKSFHLGIEIAGQAGGGEEAMELCQSLKPDSSFFILFVSFCKGPVK